MALDQGMMDDLKEFMRIRQEYLKQKHASVTADSSGTPAPTNEPQQFSHPPQPEVPPSNQSQGSGFHVVALPQDLQLNLAKCVKEDAMKVLTPETVFIQHAIREIVQVRTMLDKLMSIFNGVNNSSTRSPLLPVAHQDDHAFRPIEVQEETIEEQPVQKRRRATPKKRDANNRRSTKNRKS